MARGSKYCSFCGRPFDGTVRYVSGPGVAICEECVHTCLDILSKGQRDDGSADPEIREIPTPAELKAYLEANDIVLQAWSPLMRGAFDEPLIKELSEKYHKTPAQIILRWNLDEGALVIPKSVHRERIFENADVFDFELEPLELQRIDGLNIGRSTSTRDPETYDF